MADEKVEEDQLLPNKEDDDFLKELCSSNGINYNQLGKGGGDRVAELEYFFAGFTRIVGTKFFSNLTILKVMGQEVTKIEGLQCLPKLTELWICDCKLQAIEGLDRCKKISKLYLYGNSISCIENLSHLKDLETLWLARNQIVNVEGLTELSKLKNLNLAGNRIEKIGHSLDGHTKLFNLNLSGNNISTLKELTHLIRLPGLKILGLKDPLYAPNPVCYLCNYSTYVLYHLPSLERLDSYDVCNKTMRDMAETTVVKKKMYYNMRIKTLKRDVADMLQKLLKEKRICVKETKDRIRKLTCAIKEVEVDLCDLYNISHYDDTVSMPSLPRSADNEEPGSGTESDTQNTNIEDNQEKALSLKAKLTALKARLHLCYDKLKQMDLYHNEAAQRLKQSMELASKRLITELETGGNVRFEDGVSSDVWFTSCHDLILSRFCVADYRVYGILGIKIHRITRVHNRMLRFRFDAKLSKVTESEESLVMNKSPTVKKLQEYLFFVLDPALPGGDYQLMSLLEEGAMDADTYKQLGQNCAVPLSNSLSLCEKPRISYLRNKARKECHTDPVPFRHGQVVVCKVYLGKSVPALDIQNGIHKQFYPQADSVFRPKSSGTNMLPKEAMCECASRQCEWFLFDHELVLPEYVIDLEYITKEKPPSPFVSMEEMKPGEKRKQSIQPDLTIDDDVLLMEPLQRPRARMISLTQDLLMKAGKTKSLSLLTVLNLHGNGLSRLHHVNTLTNLQRLIVSFNELSKLEDIAHMPSLEYIDASFNKLCTLEGMKGLTKLKYLDLSWNDLTNTRDDLSILRKHMPHLNNLDLRYNNWQKPEGLRLRTIGRLKSLTLLNNQPVTESESTAALRMAAGSRVSQVSLLAHSRTDTARPRSLSLLTCAQLLTQMSRNKPDRMSESDSEWYLKVTALNLDGQHISKLSNLERLINLRWLSVSDNDLTKIEGLEHCIYLEELSLDDNCLHKLEGISHLTRLHTLNLGFNYISTLEGCGLENLSNLQCLSLECNRLSSLTGLAGVPSLLELYVGNNTIQNIREIFHLKHLPNFVILDLCGNPVSWEAENYRLFVVYHLKSLKALDGVAVESFEGGNARDVFGGRLTQDFVAEKLGHSNFHEVQELDFPQLNLRVVDLGAGEHFINLRSVNLEHNNMNSFGGLIHLINLRVLCLNHNHVESIAPKSKVGGKGSKYKEETDPYNAANFSPLLENLEVLHLGYNGITDLRKLQVSRLPSLKALFLQGNEISKVEGLEALQDLRELVLDRNKIKDLSEYSFVNQWNLVELHIEENRLRDLSHLHFLENLQRLYLGSNRLQEMGELEKLEALPNLIELSVISNPVSRRLMHRPMLVYRQPNLLCIDGIPVSPEERTKAELYFMEQQPPTSVPAMNESTLPGILPYKGYPAPVKITNVQLQGGNNSSFDRHGWSTNIQYDDGMYVNDPQRAPNRRTRSYGKSDSSVSPISSGIRTSYSSTTTQGYSMRHQHQPHQVPYVPHQNRGAAEGHGGTVSRYNRPR
ncbi:Leucine-rich repeat-containing protein 9 [Holothuria leucospilota]|uniref:Leucine-rich repeat-containing protein 9 n=1 Tax=Holothuria leucospilota TaxID=206669 RepID=A0A9Q1CJT9_HOLLE|nr:Leucine-rich repeat-containing protein 9 [Holothuria leucospilota]